MSTLEEMVSSSSQQLPFDIMRSAYAELLVTDLEVSRHFYADLLGMIVTSESSDCVYLRGWEERLHHSLVLRRADSAAAGRVAFRVRSEDDLPPLAEQLESAGAVTRWVDGELEGMGTALRAWDPLGYPLEFFHEMTQLESQMQRFDLQRGAPVMRLDHFNLHAPEPERTFRFWQQLGFRCSEYIATQDGPDGRLAGAWLLRKPTVHDVALTAGRGPRLHHVGFWVSDATAVLRVCDQLAAAGHTAALERGPGRHGVSNAFFIYMRDPDGHRIELYSCDYYTGDPDHAPLRWLAADPRCRSFWGARAPDSWYEESSTLLGPDGSQVPTFDADLDERKAWTEVMA